MSIRTTPSNRGTFRSGPGVLTLAAACAALLTGCQPSAPDAAEVARAAEAALKAQGARQAQVQVQADSFRATLVQPDGGQALLSVGAGTVTPADFGVPWYPRAEADASRMSRVGGADGQVAAAVLRTADGLDSVQRFYRDRLAALAPEAWRETTLNGGIVQFVVADGEAGTASQVRLQALPGAPAAAGPAGAAVVEISLLTTRRAPR